MRRKLSNTDNAQLPDRQSSLSPCLEGTVKWDENFLCEIAGQSGNQEHKKTAHPHTPIQDTCWPKIGANLIWNEKAVETQQARPLVCVWPPLTNVTTPCPLQNGRCAWVNSPFEQKLLKKWRKPLENPFDLIFLNWWTTTRIRLFWIWSSAAGRRTPQTDPTSPRFSNNSRSSTKEGTEWRTLPSNPSLQFLWSWIVRLLPSLEQQIWLHFWTPFLPSNKSFSTKEQHL